MYKQEYPCNSIINHGMVNKTIPGIADMASLISKDIWFFKYLGWLKTALSKMKTYEKVAQIKYNAQPKIVVTTNRDKICLKMLYLGSIVSKVWGDILNKYGTCPYISGFTVHCDLSVL